MTNEKVFAMKLSQIYPLLVAKAERKGRTREEVDTVTCWLTGYDADGLAVQRARDVDYGTFFREAPQIHPNAALAKVIISQYGGPHGELGASLRYLSQRYTMPLPELKAILTDIGTEGSL